MQTDYVSNVISSDKPTQTIQHTYSIWEAGQILRIGMIQAITNSQL